MTPEQLDIFNGAFELSGSYFTWRNALQLYRDKKVVGIFLGTPAFFIVWGLWNVFYYPSLGQMYSFLAGILLVSGNICWICFALYYRRN